MLSSIKTATIKLLTVPFEKPFPVTSAREIESVEQLKDIFCSLPQVEPAGVSSSEAVWISFMNRLRELVLEKSPREFLRWTIARR